MTAIVVRRFVDRCLLVDLSANPDGTLHHPDQVAEVPGPADWCCDRIGSPGCGGVPVLLRT
ncbi:hypothetical protein ACF1BP_37650 [Streptomyces sp. NPDC014735]|uniref:hypothetical protein n=1 Tax=unclassified Streptomyces TaxID=2593676 RepID=UPI0037023465